MKTNTLMSMALCALMLFTGRAVAAPAESQSILKALDENHARMVQAFVDRDAEAFASCWMPDIVCAVEELPLIRGREQISSVFLDAVGGASMHGLEKFNRRIWLCGDYVYEAGVYVHRFALTGREEVQSIAKDFVTVWLKQPDGSWLRAAETWNNRAAPASEQLLEWRKQTPEEIPFHVLADQADGADESLNSIIERLDGIEQSFHAVFLSDDVEPAIAMYADDARVLSGEGDWCVGRDQIRDLVMDGRKEVKLIGIECDSIASDGNGRMVYVINRFHWRFTPTGGDGTILNFFGKGLHVWQRQSDGQWKILIDINSTNPAPGETP